MTTLQTSELPQLRQLDRAQLAEYTDSVFVEWAVSNWFWFALDGSGGVGKSETQRYIEQFGIGISAGDYFRGANKALSQLGYTEQDVADLHRELHSIGITTKLTAGKKKVAIRYKRESRGEYDPEGSGDDGLRNPSLSRSLTDFLSADPVAVRWWKLQVRKTLEAAAKKHTPVISVGRTYRKIREVPEEAHTWRAHLSRSVFGYVYATKEVLAARSGTRALSKYATRPQQFSHMSKEEYIKYSVQSDWERTVLEMTRKDEQLARPQQAHHLKERGVYDFVLNSSYVTIAEVNAVHSAAIMSVLSKNTEQAALYQYIYQVLKDTYQVTDNDPELPLLEEHIDQTHEYLNQADELATT